MIKIKLLHNNTETSINVKIGSRVIDLLNKEEKTSYCVCKIGNTIKELRYQFSQKDEGKEISFLGLENIQGGKAYESTLRYVIAMAFFNLYPDVNIQFSYNVSRSIFCKILNHDLKMSDFTVNILKEVKRIIDEDYPIERVTVSIEEATDLYNKYNHLDKLAMLKYRPDSTVHLYKCDNYYDYMHAYMLPSTGCIKNYVIRPYSPGLIIQYPRYELDSSIPEFIDEGTYAKTLMNARKWSESINTNTICEINDKIIKNQNDFIQLCEAKHYHMLTELGNLISSQSETIRLITIAGPSSSGKTTFCNRLRIELLSRGLEPVMISMDDYYLSKAEIMKIQNTTLDKLDLEHVNCLDIELFNKNIYDLINGYEVTLPKFDFTTGKRIPGKTLKIGPKSPIIIEGIHALNEKLTSSIPKYQNFKIYIAPQMQINIDDHTPVSTTDIRLIRRIVRDMQFRNSSPQETIRMWQSVREGEFKWIYPNQEGADFVYNSELTYELAVMAHVALPALKLVSKDEPEYLVANRLIKLLKYFTPITDYSTIPCNSLIREFIGGSCFRV